MAFKYIELFAGIGGFRQALDRLGGTCVFASEIDKFAAQSYEALYGERPSGDITEIAAKDIPDHDVLTAGFPCQAFSVAGQRKGFEDTRGTLFFEIARIADAKRPKALLLENVKGLVNHGKGETLRIMLEALGDIGYTVDFDVLNSKFFGVPQNRERIFIVAIRDDLVASEPWTNTSGTLIVPRAKKRLQDNTNIKTFNFDYPTNDTVTTRLRDVLETHVDEKYYLSDERTAALVAQLEANEGSEDITLSGMGRLAGLRNREDRVFAYQGDRKRSTAQENIYLKDDAVADSVTVGHMPKYIESEPQMLGHVDIRGHDAIKRVYSTESVGPTLTTMGGGHREPKIAEQVPVQYNRKDGIGRELDQANTLSASDWRGLNRNQNQNAVLEEVRPVLTPDRVEKRQNGRRFKDDGEESFTLTAQDRHGVAIIQRPRGRNAGGTHIEVAPTVTSHAYHENNVVKTRYRIRKLTPLECWRLQGFSDEAHQTVVDAGVSDSQRYKQAGNAVTVNVISAIGKRLLPYIVTRNEIEIKEVA